ncbi:MAG: glutamine amidotransferase [Firmicutes bacterium]|nr:glutamine amidotransferase [Bacillota bacterium]
MIIKLVHLYAEEMNLYGDYGNILSLTKRCTWRGIDIEVIRVKRGDVLDLTDIDMLFMGGGQDRNQLAVAEDLVTKGSQIREAVERGMCVLTICGAFQLFGHYFKTKDGKELKGISVFDAYTVGSDLRMIGNILVDCTDTFQKSDRGYFLSVKQSLELIGFENHSGKTFLGKNVIPLGRVVHGYGNDGTGSFEGCRYRNAFGTYLHGSLLPKNPWFTDYLIMLALKHRYGSDVAIDPLDDSIEYSAFESAKRRSETARTTHL